MVTALHSAVSMVVFFFFDPLPLPSSSIRMVLFPDRER